MRVKERVVTVGFAIPPALKAELKARAEKEGRSVSNLVTYLLTEAVKDKAA